MTKGRESYLKIMHNSDYWIFGLLWLIIILPKTVQFAFLLFILVNLLNKHGTKFKLDVVTILMFFLFLVQCFAIIFNLIFLKTANDRVAAALNTALVWPMAAIFYSLYKNKVKINFIKVGKCCCVNIYVTTILALITIYLYYFKQISEFVIFGKYLYTTTYISDSPLPRFIGLNDYSNINVIYIMFMFVLSAGYLKSLKKVPKLIHIFIVTVLVALVNSRSGFVLYGLSLLFYFLNETAQKRGNKVWWIASILIVVFIIIFHKIIYNLILEKIIMGNTSSNGLRMNIISTSISEASNLSPIWGMGIKRYLKDGYPLGSHSTYVGFFYKTGIIGFGVGMLIIILSNIETIANLGQYKSVLLFIISFIVFFAIEDIDGCDWSAIMYFVLLAIMCDFKKAHTYKVKRMGYKNGNKTFCA